MSKVYLEECNNYNNSEKSMIKIIEFFDELKNIKKGTKVVIKANLVSAMSPDKNATTNPILLRVLTTYLLDKGCEVTIGDSPGGVYNSKYLNHVYKITKMDETKANLNNNFESKKCFFDDAKVLKSFEYTKYLDDADIKINFCKLKSHGMMSMSCAVKNLFGCIPGTLKPQYHYRFPDKKDFANMLIDINEYFKFDINIVDAITAMEGNGPTNGTNRDVGLILASTNPYALDYICSKLVNLNENDVLTINQSIERKLFEPKNVETNMDISNFVVKDFKIVKDHSLRFYDNKKDIFHKTISFFSNKIFSNKPDVVKTKCKGCKKCENICPARAIKMVNNKPFIDRKKCIKCYCCQEFCPFNAMKVKTSFIQKFIRKI